MKNKMLYFYGFAFVLYLFLYINTLSYNYVEGDDACTILYHLCGRNLNIQQPYAVYNSGFDYLLSFVENKESKLLLFSLHISFFSGLVIYLLIGYFLSLIFEVNNNLILFLCLIPFIIPELIFLNLILNTTNLGFLFALLSLIFYWKYISNYKPYHFILSTLFIGIAIPFRWSIIIFYPVFITFYFLKNSNSTINYKKIFQLTFLHFIISFVIGLVLIRITGYNFNDFVDIVFWGNNYMEKAERSKLHLLAMGISFFTIPFLFLLLFGIIHIIKNFNEKTINKIVFLFSSIFPFLILGFFPSLKYSISLIPMILILAYWGFNLIIQNKKNTILFYFSLLFIWFIGVKINTDSLTFGDGFNQKNSININKKYLFKYNVDERIKINKVYLDFDGGFYLPTPEGPRPLFGYFYVVFANLWKNNFDKISHNENQIVKDVIKNKNKSIIQLKPNEFIQCKLINEGYHPNKPFTYNSKTKEFYRNFINKNDTIKLLSIPNGVSKEKYIVEYINKNQKVYFVSYSSNFIIYALSNCANTAFINANTIYKK